MQEASEAPSCLSTALSRTSYDLVHLITESYCDVLWVTINRSLTPSCFGIFDYFLFLLFYVKAVSQFLEIAPSPFTLWIPLPLLPHQHHFLRLLPQWCLVPISEARNLIILEVKNKGIYCSSMPISTGTHLLLRIQCLLFRDQALVFLCLSHTTHWENVILPWLKTKNVPFLFFKTHVWPGFVCFRIHCYF